MRVTKEDVGRVGYALGVMVTGALIYDFVGSFADPFLWIVMAVASAGWAAYYVRVMVPRFSYFRELRDAEADEESETEGMPPGR